MPAVPSAGQGAAAGGTNANEAFLKKFERPGLMVDEVEELKEAFDLFDLDSTGRVAPRDLMAALQSLGLDNKNTVIRQLIHDLERFSGQGGLTFQDFIDLMSAKMGERDSKADIQK
eukprot:gene310-236_t